MDNFIIVPVTETELVLLQQLGRKTFYDAFIQENDPIQMEQYLVEKFSLNQLRQELNNPESAYFFAMDHSEAIGYLKVNSGLAQTEQIAANAIEIERIYVLEAYHGKQVGQLLFDKALEIAKMKKLDILWLGVAESNKKAVRFYQKNGLKKFGEHAFPFGEEVQIDILMKRNI